VRIQNNFLIAGFASWFRSGISGLLGLLSMIVLSVLVVWPLWYVATSHTYLYSLAMVVLAGGSLAFMIFSRFRKIFRNANKRSMNGSGDGLQQTSLKEHIE
jgi:hypothetical protein